MKHLDLFIHLNYKCTDPDMVLDIFKKIYILMKFPTIS